MHLACLFLVSLSYLYILHLTYAFYLLQLRLKETGFTASTRAMLSQNLVLEVCVDSVQLAISLLLYTTRKPDRTELGTLR